MAEILDYAARVAWYDEKIAGQIQAFETLGELLVEAERKVRVTTLEYLQANPEVKKVSLEKAEILAAIDDQKKCDYYEVVFLRQKLKIAEKIMGATQAGLSGIQSMMKYASPGRY